MILSNEKDARPIMCLRVDKMVKKLFNKQTGQISFRIKSIRLFSLFVYIFENIIFKKKFKAISVKLLFQSPKKFSGRIWNIGKKASKIRNVSFHFKNIEKNSKT